MYLIMYYDSATNRIEIEEYELKSYNVQDRIKELRDDGASTVKMICIETQLTFAEMVRS